MTQHTIPTPNTGRRRGLPAGYADRRAAEARRSTDAAIRRAAARTLTRRVRIAQALSQALRRVMCIVGGRR